MCSLINTMCGAVCSPQPKLSNDNSQVGDLTALKQAQPSKPVDILYKSRSALSRQQQAGPSMASPWLNDCDCAAFYPCKTETHGGFASRDATHAPTVPCYNSHLLNATTEWTLDFDAVRLNELEPRAQVQENEAFCRACVQSNGRFLKQLLDAGADPNTQNAAGCPALCLVVKAGGLHANICLLLEAGADVNATNNRGATPLHCAVLRQDLEAVKILCAAPKIDFSARLPRKKGRTALDLAYAQGLDRMIIEVLTNEQNKV